MLRDLSSPLSHASRRTLYLPDPLPSSFNPSLQCGEPRVLRKVPGLLGCPLPFSSVFRPWGGACLGPSSELLGHAPPLLEACKSLALRQGVGQVWKIIEGCRSTPHPPSAFTNNKANIFISICLTCECVSPWVLDFKDGKGSRISFFPRAIGVSVFPPCA